MTHSVPTPNKESSELLDKPLPSYEAAVTSTKMSKKKWKQQQRKQKELLKQQELQEQQKQQQQQEQQEATTTSTVVSSGDNGRVRFVLTDLHPHVEAWETAAGQSPYLTYVREPVDAASAPAKLLGQQVVDGKGVFRLFNLAFHHFDDRLARAILRNTVETSDGFGIFELQDRTLSGFLTCGLFGFFIMLVAPFLYWWSLERLFFVYVLPVVPFVLVFDGVVSCLRTRSVDEVDTLLRTCGTNTDGWEIQSGRERHLWPCGYLNWIICTKKKHE
ncbi:hypothetical protein F4779DRAFT_129828 [Xylariaceae sp. FL0662B]|nr:hypothetical protein F4779DRAFT_129828 [Xylariaceae sp. FL0662B]